MAHIGFAVFSNRDAASRARQTLLRRGAAQDSGHLDIDRVRMHDGAVDPQLSADLTVTDRQKVLDKRLLLLWIAPITLGALLGWLVGQGARAMMFGPGPPLAWAGLGGFLGLVAAAGMLLARRHSLRYRAVERITAAVDHGDVVLSVRCAASAAGTVRTVMRENGGRYEQLD